jgi:RimJ/RimL family protein N-acetyltransferase
VDRRTTWARGETVVLRYRSIDGVFRAGRPLIVVKDGDEWLVTYLPAGTHVAEPILADSRNLRDAPLEERWRHPRATRIHPWRGGDLVMLFPRGRAYSLWLFREHGEFLGWYVNLEDRHELGLHTIEPDPTWPRPALPPGWDAGPLETPRLTLTPLRHHDAPQYGRLAADPLGEVGLSTASWPGIGADEVEIGWVVDEEQRCAGVATEAMEAVLADPFGRSGVDHVVAYIRPESSPSLRVAEKLGLRYRGAGRSHGGDAVEIWERARVE